MAGGHLRKGRIITKFNDSQFSNKYDIKHQQKYKQEELPSYTDHTNDKKQPLTDTEIEELFWAKLVHLGWKKKQNKSNLSYVFVWSECDSILDQHLTLIKEKAKEISTKEYADQLLSKHTCKAIPEAIPEAIPKDY